MVRILTIIIISLLTHTALAAQLDVSSNKLKYGKDEQIYLNVSLKDARAKSDPNLGEFYDAGFILTSNKKAIKTQLINGQRVNLVQWQYAFKTKREGKITLPTISINTDQGNIVSKALTIEISKKLKSSNNSGDKVLVKAQLADQQLYVNQTTILTIELTRFVNIFNLQLIFPENLDFVVTNLGQSAAQETYIGNERAVISKYYYAISPLKSGALQLALPTVKAAINAGDNSSYYGLSFRLNNFSNYKDIKITSEPLQLKAKTISNKEHANLPLDKLTITTNLDGLEGKQLIAGKSYNFSIDLAAKDIFAKHLPELIFPENAAYKIYAEAPELTDNFNEANLALEASKNFKFTLIPASSGVINIPQLTVKWWDIKQHKAKIARSKNLNLTVDPAVNQEKFISKDFQKTVAAPVQNTASDPQQSKWLYLLIATNLLSIIIIIYLWLKPRKHMSKSKNTTAKKTFLKTNFNFPKIADANELEKFCLQYFSKFYQEKFTNLQQIFAKLENDYQGAVKLKTLNKNINSALYHKKKLNLEKTLAELKLIIKELGKNKSAKVETSAAQHNFKLNP